MSVEGQALEFDSRLKKPPAYALCLISPDNAYVLCITSAVST